LDAGLAAAELDQQMADERSGQTFDQLRFFMRP